MGNHDRGNGTLTNGVGRRDVLKGIGAAGLLSLPGFAGSATASVENEAGDGEPVIYQYFHTAWTDIEERVDLLAEAGVTAVWLPQPAVSKLDWDHLAYQGEEGFYEGEESPYGGRDPHPPVGYQPVDLRDFDGTFGTEAELRSLIDALHERDIDVILDAVLNHMADPNAPQDPWGGELDWPQFETETHFTQVPYDDYTGDIENAQYDQSLLDLPNLDVHHPHVQDAQVAYIEKLADVGADGLRFDAIKHVWPDYLENVIVPLCDDLGLWRVGEYWEEGNTGELLEFADVGIDVFDFPLYASLVTAVENGDLTQLHADSGSGVVHEDPDVAVTFAQNHDTVGPGVVPDQREGDRVDLAYAFILSYPGTTHLYRSGVRAEGPWDLEEPAIRDLIWVKTHLASGALIDRHAGSETYVYEREGNLLAGISVADGARTHAVQTSWSDETLVDATGNGDDVATDENGRVEITVPAAGWVMYAPEALVEDPPEGGVSVTIDAVDDGDAVAGDDVAVEVTVDNGTDASVSREIGLTVDGAEVDSTAVSLASGGTESVTLTYGNATAGDHTVTVDSEDDAANATIEVADPDGGDGGDGGDAEITLSVDAQTEWGESVFFTGSADVLTNWGGGVEGTHVDGVWEVTIEDPGDFEWKTRRGEYGATGEVWEAGDNHTDDELSPTHQGWEDR